ncbi:hypothetical protein [Ruegeria sp. HKCCD8929]|uniref:hypothetical protein n=1 Tax=Ruegeria sp. HKCCD8929 TaxID=2683006 RepID=UPI0014886EF9|nr:hypothetical protein [Ruegeria sp. HKCCD8929]
MFGAMAIGLLKLSSGHFSLEFEEEDVSDVVEAIRTEFGKAEQKQFVMAREVKFGGATFVFQNEWQDPCLVSSSLQGDQCLRQIHEKLSRQ